MAKQHGSREPFNSERGYLNISDHALIGNLRTAAMISVDGSVESYCIPNFDSPSVFARILDKDKGGHFSITPKIPYTTKQAYMPSSNILQTKFLSEEGIVTVTDFLPRQADPEPNKPLLFWLIRRVEVIRGAMPIRMECAPAFNYARSAHQTSIIPDDSVADIFPHPPSTTAGITSNLKLQENKPHQKVLFKSEELTLDLRYIAECSADTVSIADASGLRPPVVDFAKLDLSAKGHLGESVSCDLDLIEGQTVTFVLRTPPEKSTHRAKPTQEQADAVGIPLENLLIGASKMRPRDDPLLTASLLQTLLKDTNRYWIEWIRRSTYNGSWKEAVHRSALALKLLIFEPTGAIVASPTFSLPEYIGGTRNWDYRFSWIRDSSFTLYALIRLGFTQEANAYMEFIFSRLKHRNPDGSLQIMYTIHGEKELAEIELSHLDGHKGSKPVRIGNGAADHVQLDIYGELMDCIYLGQKFGKPLSYDTWVAVRELVEYVIANYKKPDLSIWEVRGRHRHFTYSKVMMWVAIDRGLRLADKRSFPCPRRLEWTLARDELYEEIMTQAWNSEKKFFCQSYEDKEILDSAVLIMPLVFFCAGSEDRFLSTLKQVLRTPERGGLTTNNLVYRYDVTKTDDGVGGEEGTFCLCTLWCVEALTRAGQYDRSMLPRAISMFEDFLQYLNHVGLCTEEISAAGEGLGNAVQGFTHVTLISAAYNLSRTLANGRAPTTI
ncbi:glycoside hydrolase family 15 protein [Schizopora paradoxa]|uniref:Glycoside hydrolase family 15 protein n=1 Tax=Schizopora paradoxa TaxID=27342 RepID=A0A0H2RE87_9AGAM|nr:glycoside hydrolase family 15 protein [Schizopora paradoxa]